MYYDALDRQFKIFVCLSVSPFGGLRKFDQLHLNEVSMSVLFSSRQME